MARINPASTQRDTSARAESRRDHGKELLLSAPLFLFFSFRFISRNDILIILNPFIMCKLHLGHAVFSHDAEIKPLTSLPSPNVPAKTPDITEDHDLDIKDEENNKFQQEILRSYIVENRKNKFSKPETASAPGPRSVSIANGSPSNKVGDDVDISLLGSDSFDQNQEAASSVHVRSRKMIDNMVEHEMELILFQENSISEQMTILEHKIRESQSDGKESQNLLNAWFELISQKNMIFHRRLMLEILQNEQDLERRCQILQAELRSQDLDHQTETLLLEELVRLVDLRDKLVSEQMNEEDLLCREESIGKEVQTCLISKTSKCQLQ